jgi:hypothetical protein
VPALNRSPIRELVVLALLLGSTISASAWSESDCRAKCSRTAVDVAACITYTPCTKYRGQPSDGQRAINAGVKAWNSARGTPAQRRAAGKTWRLNGPDTR